MKNIIICLIVFCGLFAISCSQKKTDVKARLCIKDEIHLLTEGQYDSLTEEMRELENSVGSQMAVLIIGSLNGQKIEEYSLNIANQWGLGRKDYNDGVLITVALHDRQMRIEVGTGLERIIPDETAARVIEENIVPEFAEEKYFDGLYSGVTRLKGLITENQDLIGQRP